MLEQTPRNISIILGYAAGETQASLSARLGINISTVKKVLRKAKAQGDPRVARSPEVLALVKANMTERCKANNTNAAKVASSMRNYHAKRKQARKVAPNRKSQHHVRRLMEGGRTREEALKIIWEKHDAKNYGTLKFKRAAEKKKVAPTEPGTWAYLPVKKNGVVQMRKVWKPLINKNEALAED